MTPALKVVMKFQQVNFLRHLSTVPGTDGSIVGVTCIDPNRSRINECMMQVRPETPWLDFRLDKHSRS